MATVTKPASSHTVVTTGWTNPSNAFASTGDNVYATAAPAKNVVVNGDFGFSFALADFVGATQASDVNISSVTVTCEWKLSVTTSATLGVQLRNNGVALGAETTFSSTTESDSTQVASSGIVASDLLNGLVVARVRDTRGNTTTAHTGSLDFVKVDVVYSVVITHTDGGSGTITLSGARAESQSSTGSGSATLTLSGVGVDDFHPPGTTNSDSGTGTVSLAGFSSAVAVYLDASSGTISLSGSRFESANFADPHTATVVLSGSATEIFTGEIQTRVAPFLLFSHTGMSRMNNIEQYLDDNMDWFLRHHQTGTDRMWNIEYQLIDNPINNIPFVLYAKAGTDRMWAIEEYLLRASNA